MALTAAGPMASASEADRISPTQAAEAAAVVERVTGIADIAPSAALADGTTQSVSTSERGSSIVTAPATADGAVQSTAADGITVSIGLPGNNNAPAVKTENGTIVYHGAGNNADLAVQPTESGVRALITLNNASAPTEYRFDLGLPQGAEAERLADGSVLVIKGDEILGMFASPWAKDANGATVPTSYRVEGKTLIQTISTTPGTAFPVVADPAWWDKTKEIAGGMVSDTWNSIKCGGALGAAFIPGAKAYKAIKAAGGVKKVLSILASVDTKKGALSALGSGGSTLFGIKAIKKACFDDLK